MNNSSQTALAELAVESWRFANDYRRLVARLDANEQNRFANKLLYFVQRVQSCLDQAELRLVNLEGHSFDIGIAAEVINLDEFSEDDSLVVDQMLEPLIMGPNGIVKTAKVMLRRRSQER